MAQHSRLLAALHHLEIGLKLLNIIKQILKLRIEISERVLLLQELSSHEGGGGGGVWLDMLPWKYAFINCFSRSSHVLRATTELKSTPASPHGGLRSCTRSSSLLKALQHRHVLG